MANAFSISKPNVGERPSNGVLLSLSVPEDGDYAIFAKLNLNNNASGVKTVTCQLKAGEHDSSGVFDPTTVHQDVNIIRLAENGEENLDMAAVALHLFQESFQGIRKNMINCIQLIYSEEPPGRLVYGGRAVISAIKVDIGGATFCR